MKDRVIPLKEGEYEVGREKRIILFAIVLVLLSFTGCITLSVLEILSLRPEKGIPTVKPQTSGQVQPALKPKIHPLTFLPDMIEDFVINARQEVPGYESYMAEAIYQPEDEELTSVTPINTYARITFFERTYDAEKAITEDLTERYPRDRQIVDLNGQKASSGYEQNQKSFFIGWSHGQYAIEIDTSFTSGAPGTKGKILYESGNKVAVAVQKKLAEVLTKK